MYERFAKLYDALMRDVDYDGWAAYIDSFVMPGSTIAECACGTGEITIRLAKAGHKLTGIDISQEMLEIAFEKAREQGLNIPLICMDMRHFTLHRPVDAIVCACDGVNYLSSRTAVDEFFHSAAAMLKPQGKLIFDISSRYKLSKVLGCNTFAEDETEQAYIWKNYYDEQAKLLEMRLSFFTKNGKQYDRFCETHVQRAHSLKELSHALTQAGFSYQAYDAFTLNPPREDSERIAFAAVKNT